jgi:hypothetical protein
VERGHAGVLRGWVFEEREAAIAAADAVGLAAWLGQPK